MAGLAQVSTRPETPEDSSFLGDLYFSVRELEPGFASQPLDERSRVLRDQARLQSIHYHKVFPHAHFLVVEVDGKPVGRFCVNQFNDHLLVVDLSILPDFQGHGIGSQLIKSVLAESTRTGMPVGVSVEIGHPARSFYERMGFAIFKNTESHHVMQWVPSRG